MIPSSSIDFNAVLSAAINFLIVAAVIYFVIVLPYKKLRRNAARSRQAQDTELSLLTEIRDLLSENGGSAEAGIGSRHRPSSPDTAEITQRRHRPSTYKTAPGFAAGGCFV